MKKFSGFFSKIILSLSILLLTIQTAVFAQDAGGSGGGVNVNISKDSGSWYAQPWIWIIGGAVFLLLLVALLRNNNSKN